MESQVQVALAPDDDVYATPDVARIGTVEQLTEGSVFVSIGDCASSAC